MFKFILFRLQGLLSQIQVTFPLKEIPKAPNLVNISHPLFLGLIKKLRNIYIVGNMTGVNEVTFDFYVIDYEQKSES